MNDWKDKLKKLAEEQGMELENTTESSDSEEQINYGRKPVKQTRKIKSARNPEFNREASAPYNFVPLNEKIIHGETFAGFDTYDTKNRNTGFIECEIETLTPIYIRDTISKSDFDAGKTSKEVSSFFSPTGKACIPGSSLRGTIRNLVEILSWSKLHTDVQRQFYYRGLADKSNLRKEYQSHMSSFDKRKKMAIYKMNAGYLQKEGIQYRIIPAQFIGGKQFHQIYKDQTKTLSSYANRHKLDDCYKFFKDGSNAIVISGPMPKKKRDWVVYPPDLKVAKISIPDEDVVSYQLDENRTAVNLIAELDKGKHTMLPCFYVQWVDNQNRKRVSFGHTAMFRLAYQQKLGDLLPEEMSNFVKVDIAESIFGTVDGRKTIAGRVYFEDAGLAEEAPQKPEKKIPAILASPKPTTFQHYLVQKSDYIRELKHYNSDDTFLRGHKLYWHRIPEWQAKNLTFNEKKFNEFMENKNLTIPPEHKEVKDNKIIILNFPDIKDKKLINAIFEFIQADEKSQYTVIEALDAGTKFKARIRFENLTHGELGALLSALDLPDTCCHKVGLGKPIGLGSVRITPKLFLSDRQKRYASLKAEWVDDNMPVDNDRLKSMKTEFENYILSKLTVNEKPASGGLWDTYRLKQLRVLLDWKNTERKYWNEKTRYLEIQHERYGNEYKDRRILPIPEDVV